VLERGEQRRNMINEIRPRQRVALGQVRISMHGALPRPHQVPMVEGNMVSQRGELPRDVLQFFSS
jgi:hypothetical protein